MTIHMEYNHNRPSYETKSVLGYPIYLDADDSTSGSDLEDVQGIKAIP